MCRNITHTKTKPINYRNCNKRDKIARCQLEINTTRIWEKKYKINGKDPWHQRTLIEYWLRCLGRRRSSADLWPACCNWGRNLNMQDDEDAKRKGQQRSLRHWILNCSWTTCALSPLLAAGPRLSIRRRDFDKWACLMIQSRTDRLVQHHLTLIISRCVF